MQRVTQHPTIATKQRSPIFRAEWWRNGAPLLTNAALLLLGGIMLEFTRTGVDEFHHSFMATAKRYWASSCCTLRDLAGGAMSCQSLDAPHHLP